MKENLKGKDNLIGQGAIPKNRVHFLNISPNLKFAQLSVNKMFTPTYKSKISRIISNNQRTNTDKMQI